MKILYLILTILLATVTSSPADTTFSNVCVLKNLTIDSGGDTVAYQDIIFYHNCDALGDATKATGSDTMTIGSGISIGTGVYSGSFLDSDGADNFSYVMANNITLTSGRFGFYWKPTSDSTNTGNFFWTSADNEFGLYNSAGTARMTYDTTQVNTFAISDLTAGTWYYFEFKFTGTSVVCYIDNVEKGTKTNLTPTFTDTIMYFMDRPAYAHMGGEFDQIMCSNDEDRSLYAIRNVTDFN